MKLIVACPLRKPDLSDQHRFDPVATRLAGDGVTPPFVKNCTLVRRETAQRVNGESPHTCLRKFFVLPDGISLEFLSRVHSRMNTGATGLKRSRTISLYDTV